MGSDLVVGDLVRQIEGAPEKPGVYQFLDAKGQVIYVGKARNLRARLRQYLQGGGTNPKPRAIVRRAHAVKTIVTETEEEACLLEYALIKRYQPMFNVMWRDGKSFPYICIKKERFPRVMVMRRPKDDGSEYYGPFSVKHYLDALMELLRSLVPLRTCNYKLTEENIRKKKFRKCLEYHLGRCGAPCEGLQTEAEYMKGIRLVRKILRGEVESVVRRLRQRMRRLAEDLRFEEAMRVKAQIERLEALRQKPFILRGTQATADIFAYRSTDTMAFVHYLQMVEGMIVVSHTMRVRKRLSESDEDLLRWAVLEARTRFHSRARLVIVPFWVMVPVPASGASIEVKIVADGGEEGEYSGLMRIAEKNLDAFIEQYYPEASERMHPALPALQKLLHLPRCPEHIECIDISTLGGKEMAGSVVVFRRGFPVRREYRHYWIRTVAHIDDYRAVAEVVTRRYRRLLDEEGEDALPDLVLIDGGGGQAGKARDALDQLGLHNVPVFGLAKRLEVLYPPHRREPIYIDRRSLVILLLQRIRNEAQRFANRLREKGLLRRAGYTILQEVPGIGARRAERLLRTFGSIERILNAPEEELAQVVGSTVARVLKRYLVRRWHHTAG